MLPKLSSHNSACWHVLHELYIMCQQFQALIVIGKSPASFLLSKHTDGTSFDLFCFCACTGWGRTDWYWRTRKSRYLLYFADVTIWAIVSKWWFFLWGYPSGYLPFLSSKFNIQSFNVSIYNCEHTISVWLQRFVFVVAVAVV